MAAGNTGDTEKPFAASAVAATPAAYTNEGPSILWPIAVVGGSIAVAAFGVLGLYSMGASAPAGLKAGGTAISSLDDALAAPTVKPETFNPTTTVESLTQLSNDDGQESGGWIAGDVGSGSTTTLLLRPTDDGRVSTTSLAFDDDQIADPDAGSSRSPVPGSPGRNAADSDGPDPADQRPDASDSTDLETPSDELLHRAPEDDSPLARFAVYESPDLTTKPIASLTAIDGWLLSSAGALNTRDAVWVRVGGQFHAATVIGSDMLSDVAVIELSDTTEPADIPAFDPAAPNGSKLLVTVGYCDDDKSGTKPPDDCPSWCHTDQEVQDESASETPEDTESTILALQGNTYPTNSPALTASNHMVFSPIKTHIRRTDEMSGAPLRNEAGKVIGMVAGGTGQYVFAVPIDRAVSTAEALVERGTGSLAWLGVEAVFSDDGLLVSSVSELSPLAELVQVGDLLLTVNGEPLTNRDHLIHLIRQAGVGANLRIVYLPHSPESAVDGTADGPVEVDITIAEVPSIE